MEKLTLKRQVVPHHDPDAQSTTIETVEKVLDLVGGSGPILLILFEQTDSVRHKHNICMFEKRHSDQFFGTSQIQKKVAPCEFRPQVSPVSENMLAKAQKNTLLVPISHSLQQVGVLFLDGGLHAFVIIQLHFFAVVGAW